MKLIPPVNGRWKVIIVDDPMRRAMVPYGVMLNGLDVPGYIEMDVDLYCYIGGMHPELLAQFDMFERVTTLRGDDLAFVEIVPLETWPDALGT